MALSGTVAGRFVVEEPIASGGMGCIYRAKDLETGQYVALKELTLQGEEAENRFEREAVMLSVIESPHVVRYVAHGSHEHHHFLAMELVSGEPLSRRLTVQGLNVEEALEVGRQLALALGALHRMGLVHRDIKPPNVMVPLGGVSPATLVDFGLVRKGERLSSLTQTGMALGSPGYMSPEQAGGERDLTPASDVFSLGCVLYVSLTGYQPFPGQHPLAVQTRALVSPPPLANLRNPEVPVALAELLSRMFSVDPLERPQTGDEAFAALRPFTGLPSTLRMKLKLRQAPQKYVTPNDSTAEVVIRAHAYAVAIQPVTEDENALIVHEPEFLDTLRKLADLHGANLANLYDGTLVFLAKRREVPLEQATIATQLAADLVRRLPDWIVSLALGGAGADDVVDRALELLAAEQVAAAMLGAPGKVRLDQETARRLAGLANHSLRGSALYLEPSGS
jgi:serine/threonine protein kinase